MCYTRYIPTYFLLLPAKVKWWVKDWKPDAIFPTKKRHWRIFGFDFSALLLSSSIFDSEWWGHRTFLQFLGFCLIINEWNCQKWMRKFLDCHEKWGTSALRSVHNFSNKSTCLYCVTLNFTTELLWRPTHPLITLCAKKLLQPNVLHLFIIDLKIK